MKRIPMFKELKYMFLGEKKFMVNVLESYGPKTRSDFWSICKLFQEFKESDFKDHLNELRYEGIVDFDSTNKNYFVKEVKVLSKLTKLKYIFLGSKNFILYLLNRYGPLKEHSLMIFYSMMPTFPINEFTSDFQSLILKEKIEEIKVGGYEREEVYFILPQRILND